MQAGLGEPVLQLIGHPISGFGFTMAEHHDTRFSLKGEIHQFITLRMRRQIKGIHDAATCQISGTITEGK